MRLFFRSTGAGPPLVILHGLFGSSNNWNGLAKQLGTDFTVYAVDLRNHGRSPHDAVHTYEAMAGDVAEFLQQESLPSVFLLGHSMGGKVAMELALSDSSKVRRVIVVDISPGESPLENEAILRALLSLRLEECTSRTDIDHALQQSIPDDRVREFLLTNIRRGEDGIYVWRMNLPALDSSREAVAAPLAGGRRFEGPALFLRAEHSAYVRDDDIPLIKRMFPRAEVRTIPGSGHWVHADAPGPFVSAVRSFLLSSSRE